VENSEQRLIGQVFTSTMAGGGYGTVSGVFRDVCRHLLRAAYLGTLLAAVTLNRPRVVLTLIGGGVFGNPADLIWESILWAAGEVEPFVRGEMDVIVNGYNIGRMLDPEVILAGVRSRGGAMLVLGRGNEVTIHR
jgi:hypothetical protein